MVDEVVARRRGEPVPLGHLVEGGDVTTGATLPALIDGYLYRAAVGGPPGPGLPGEWQSRSGRSDLTALAGEDAIKQAEAAGVLADPRDGTRSTRRIRSTPPARLRRWRRTPHRRCACRWSNTWRPARHPRWANSCGSRLWPWTATTRTPSAIWCLRPAACPTTASSGWPSRLAPAALNRSGGLPARLALGYALAWQGRGREADAVLAAVDPEQLSQSELMEWAMPRAAAHRVLESTSRSGPPCFCPQPPATGSRPRPLGDGGRAGRDVRHERGNAAARIADRRRGVGRWRAGWRWDGRPRRRR